MNLKLFRLFGLIVLFCIAALVSCRQPESPLFSPDAEDPVEDPAPVEDTELELLSVTPATGIYSIDPDTVFTLSFNKHIDESTLVDGILLNSSSDSIAVSAVLDGENPKLVQVTPSGSLAEDRNYTLTITEDLADTEGDHLESEEYRDFRTRSALKLPEMTVNNGNTSTAMPDGSWLNKDMRVKLSISPTDMDSEGIMAVQWSFNNGTDWEESAASAGDNYESFTVVTSDGDDILVRPVYRLSGEVNVGAYRTYHIDKTAPLYSSDVETASGVLKITFSEDVYSYYNDNELPGINDFTFYNYSGDPEFTLNEVTTEGVEVTLNFTCNNSDSGTVQVYITVRDRAGNEYRETIDSDIELLPRPYSPSGISRSNGTITFTGMENAELADSYIVSCSTDSGTWNSSKTLVCNAGEEVTFSGLNPETRYYLLAKSRIGETNESAVSWVGDYLYPVELFSSGSGTSGNPWKITTRAELEAMLVEEDMRDDFFELTGDIDLSRYSWWSPYDLDSRKTLVFSGTFDGCGYAIKNLNQNYQRTYTMGVFSIIDGGTVRNLLIEGAVFADGLSGGSLVSKVTGNSLIEYVAVTGFSSATKGEDIGGLISEADGSSAENPVTIRNCFVQGVVTDATSYRNGGLLGSIGNYTVIEDCYAAVDFISADGWSTGGLVGRAGLSSPDIRISRSFSSGKVDTDESSAGLLGDVDAAITIEDCASMAPEVGNASLAGEPRVRFRLFSGLLSSPETITNNYAYSEMLIDGNMVSEGDIHDGASISLADFLDTGSSLYGDWNFDSIWVMTSKGPLLRNMPLGGGMTGTPDTDPIGWDGN